MRNKLGARFHHLSRPAGGPKLLLACLPGDRHETGLLLFALSANAAGYMTILLGADMPLEDLPAVARKTGSSGIVLSGVLLPGSELLDSALPELTQQTDVPVFLGGHASVKVHDALKRAGVKALGTDLKTGLARLLEVIPVKEIRS